MKKINSISLVFAFSILLMSSCKNADEIRTRALANAAVPVIEIIKAVPPQNLGEVYKSTITEFKQAIENKIGVLVDVRTPEEFAKGHLEGAVNINFKKRTFPSYISAIAKDKPVLIYCRSGNRSGKAALIMQSLGFKEIYDLASGYKGWNAKKMTILTEDNDANKKLQEQLKAEAPKAEAIVGKGHQMSTNDFEKLVKEGKVTLIDLRTVKEFSEGHIEGAINVDWKNRHFADNALKTITNKKPVAIYCRSGNRATRAMFAMSALGFSEVYNLDQGLKSWGNAEKPLKTLEIKGDIRHLDTDNFNNAILGQVGTLIDIRTPREYDDFHIPGAIMINYLNNSSFKAEVAKLDKKIPVLIYCRTGARSGRAMKKLEKMGFRVYNLDKGIKAWRGKGMHIEGNNIQAKDNGEEGC